MRACIHILDMFCFVLSVSQWRIIFYCLDVSRSDIILEAAGHGVAEPGADNV